MQKRIGMPKSRPGRRLAGSNRRDVEPRWTLAQSASDPEIPRSSDAPRAGVPGESSAAYPRMLGRYRIIGELGRGAMGVVFLGEDPDLAREVAIKILPPHLSRSEASYEGFQREARLLAALNHPNVATIHSLEIIEDTPLLTMERIRGRTLAARISRGALPVEELLQIGVKIARAIEAAHDRGVIHRDIKPGNVMIRDDDEVKVLDFGLARSLIDALPSGLPTPSARGPARYPDARSGRTGDPTPICIMRWRSGAHWVTPALTRRST